MFRGETSVIDTGLSEKSILSGLSFQGEDEGPHREPEDYLSGLTFGRPRLDGDFGRPWLS